MKADPEIHPLHSLAGRGVYLLDGHEIVRRGLRQLLRSDGLGIAGESGSARVAVRRSPALRPALVIVDDNLPDGSGAEVCRAIAAADPVIRCVLMTDDSDEALLIDSILAGAWGCLSKQDDGGEQLRLIRRALAGHTAYSGRFQAALLAPFVPPAPQLLDKRLLSLTRQEMNAAIGLGKGQSNRQISKEMMLAEKTVKNLVSSVLTKLGMARRTQAAVLITRVLNPSDDPADGDYRSSLYPHLIAEVTAALLHCTSESRAVPLTDELRARDTRRLADALASARTGRRGLRPLQSRT
jgi:DNA-binding NarL/FixJ family response regulator